MVRDTPAQPGTAGYCWSVPPCGLWQMGESCHLAQLFPEPIKKLVWLPMKGPALAGNAEERKKVPSVLPAKLGAGIFPDPSLLQTLEGALN